MKETFINLKKKYNNLDLKFKLLIPIISVLFIALLTFTIYLINDQKQKSEKILKKKSKNVSFVLQEAVIDAVWKFDETALQANCKAVFEDPEVTMIKVILNDGTTLLKLEKKVKGSKDLLIKNKLTKENSVIASMEIVFTNYYIEENIFAIGLKLGILSIVIFLIIIYLIIVLMNLSLKPLDDLMVGVQKLTNGDLKHKVDVRTGDELGKLANSFNVMSKELYNHTENLEMLVKKRTKELEDVMLELEASNSSLMQTKDALWSEMELAKRIQTVLIPQNPQINNYIISTAMYPTDEVGGDYYDVLNTGNITWVIIGDVSGHGVSAGLVMMMVQTAIQVVIRNNPDIKPSDLLMTINKAITYNIQMMGENKYMTITVLAILPNGELLFSGLHEDLLVFRHKEKKVETIETKGFWLGINVPIKKNLFEDNKVKLNKNDAILLFTDGVTESYRKTSDGECIYFGNKRLADILEKKGEGHPDELKDQILKELSQYETDDDVTFVALKRIN